MDTREKILNYIKLQGKARVDDIKREFGLGRSIIHRHLLKLVGLKLLTKYGKPPLVFYIYNLKQEPLIKNDLDNKKVDFLQKNYLCISSNGEMVYGFDGFKAWVEKTKQEKYLYMLIDEFIKNRISASKHKNRLGLVESESKFKNTFSKVFVEKVYFADFYSLPKFGKTILGQKVLYAKQAQLTNLIVEISKSIEPLLKNLINSLGIEAVAFIPPTIPRNVQFLREIERNINLKLPKVDLVKAYQGQIPVAQKTLSKLEERIDNAKNSIFIKAQKIEYKKILLIDDAIGSGATINESAAKIKLVSPKAKVYGFGIVGSFKGFDVISEV